jgi:hypothetical protein
MPDLFISPDKPAAPQPAQSSSHGGLRQAFSSYVAHPVNVRFETQRENEQVVLLLRQHWITNVTWILLAIILIITPFFLFPILIHFSLIPIAVPPVYIQFSVLVWYLIIFSFILVNFLMWYINIWIVTSERLIDIDFVNLLNKKFSETLISKIEDVTGTTAGILGAFIDFGDIFAQTAAAKTEFEAYKIPHPQRVVKLINDLMSREQEDLKP